MRLSTAGGRSPAVRIARRAAFTVAAIAGLGVAAPGFAQGAHEVLPRAAEAARTLSYSGTIVYQRGNTMESSRIVHVNEAGDEQEKLVSLDGPAREVIREKGEVRCYYPDAKTVRIAPRTFRNAFPALSPQQQGSLVNYYTMRAGEGGRVAGIDAKSWRFEPKDGLRYAHEFWTDPATGMLLKARILSERGEVVGQYAFTDLAIDPKLDRAAANPTWSPAPANWRVRQMKLESSELTETGWKVAKPPAGFVRIMEGRRGVGDRLEGLTQIVYSDGLVAVSIFVERRGGAQRYYGKARQGGINQYSVRQDDYVITALGEVPAETVRQFATSVARR